MKAKNKGLRKQGQGKETGRFHDDPDDVIHSATYGMAVSRQGKDLGAVKRDTKEVLVSVDGGTSKARAVKDPIDRMHEAGNISDESLIALRLFQKEFDRCGYARYAKMDMDRAGSGGGRGIEDVFASSQHSRDYVQGIFRLLGGISSPMSVVMFWVVGMGCSFDGIVQAQGDSKHYWRGAFYSAVKVIEQDYVRMCRGSRRTIRSPGIS